MYKHQPLGTNILTKQNEDKTTVTYGLITNIGGNDGKRPDIATVVAVGEQVTDVKVGDVVFFSKYAGVPIEAEGERYLLLGRGEIFGFNPDKLDIKMGETKDLLGLMENIGQMIEGD